ncbi:MAG: hypothetical protein KBA75_02070 [Alphaproteobacteria bacterium]|nr:hypothetical protein [Alphaproteobacteria bacterium]
MNFDTQAFFKLLDSLPALVETDPRQGCIVRTQIIGSLLHDLGQAVGRAWILPVYETESFLAPLYDTKGQLVKLTDSETGTPQTIKWRFHCATVLLDQPEQPVIDFPLFSSPVSLAIWEQLFVKTQERHAPKGQEACGLRVVSHVFADIPQRQVLRYNPQAEKQNKLLSLPQLAKRLTLTPHQRAAEAINFVRHKGDYKPS